MSTEGSGFQLPEVESIRRRAAEVRHRIEAASPGAGDVLIIGVTKAFPAELSRRALQAGLIDLGENYAQELAAKCDELGFAGQADAIGGETERAPLPTPAPRWHFIGGLQRNKVKLLAGKVDLWHTIDRISLVDEIAKRCPGDGILIQVNTTGEAQKSGCDPSGTMELVEHARSVGLDARGLMTVGPTDTATDPRPSFDALRQLAERCEVRELSMGMSGDYELAVAAGATMVRVGSVLFGPRPPKP